ncbi:NAD-dependent protein deacylase Sirt4 [Anthonomus grandis grandis]|uniref:NAD-dependent protein deacylase Sirt4 n=1 Tax=Anthonomus grandis grandis TaxID=2921223 RepID=UPI00216598B1|nr:NAD-dependent protein deacylase Sirt4 [Anthonomus grandis grandis]
MSVKIIQKIAILRNLLLARQYSTQLQQFVPKHNPCCETDVNILQDFLDHSKKVLVLTGAGISTESGIPDYRSEGVGLYARTNHKPIQHIEFIKSASVRQRYWARNFVGWFRFSKSKPNPVHVFIRDLEIEDKKVHFVVTQNVDSLHFKAGSKNVIELHGTAYRVICLNCEATYDRHYIQNKLLEYNNVNFEDTANMIRPDGDVEIPMDFIKGFTPPSCESCNGILKPHITFFGDNVPRATVDLVKEKMSESDSLLVLGSSLSVFSGYRIVLQALDESKNVCIINIGPTRADKLIKLKIEAKCGDILPKFKR